MYVPKPPKQARLQAKGFFLADSLSVWGWGFWGHWTLAKGLKIRSCSFLFDSLHGISSRLFWSFYFFLTSSPQGFTIKWSFKNVLKVSNLELQFVIWRVFRLEAAVRRSLSFSAKQSYVRAPKQARIEQRDFFGDSFSVWGRGCSWTLAKGLKSRSISFDSIVLVMFFSLSFWQI